MYIFVKYVVLESQNLKTDGTRVFYFEVIIVEYYLKPKKIRGNMRNPIRCRRYMFRNKLCLCISISCLPCVEYLIGCGIRIYLNQYAHPCRSQKMFGNRVSGP